MANKIDDVINELQKTITYLDWRDETRVTMRIDQVQKILKRVLNLAQGSQGEQKYDLLASGSHIDFTFEVGSDQVYQGPNVLNFGDVLKITAEAETGWELASLLVNGSAFTSGNTITINDTTCPQGWLTVVATANSLGFDLSRTSVAHGTITVTDATTGDAIADGSMVLTAGQTINITFAGDNGYVIHEFLINGTDYATTPPQQTITVSNYVVEDDVVISGSLSVVRYTVSVVTAPNTSIDIYLNGTLKTGTIRAVYGDVLTFDVTPNDAVVTINGDTYNEGDQYTVTSSTIVEVNQPSTEYSLNFDTTLIGNGISSMQFLDANDNELSTAHYGDTIAIRFAWESGYTFEWATINGVDATSEFTIDTDNNEAVIEDYVVTENLLVAGLASDGYEDLMYETPAQNTTVTYTVNGTPTTPSFDEHGYAYDVFPYGSTVVITFTPDTGYIAVAQVNGEEYESGTPITVDRGITLEIVAVPIE